MMANKKHKKATEPNKVTEKQIQKIFEQREKVSQQFSSCDRVPRQRHFMLEA